MESESTEQVQLVYETLKNIDLAITRLQERTVQIHTVDDFLLSPMGLEKLDAACMVLIALGESVKTLDKLTDKKAVADLSLYRLERNYGGKRYHCTSLF